MIVLKSKGQIKSLLKRLKPVFVDEGCGCCYYQKSYHESGNKIVCVVHDETAGSVDIRVSVIARIRRS